MTEPRNTIRTFALVCVAITSLFVIGMGIWLTMILSAPDWCARALGAGGIIGKDRTVVGLDGCISLLTVQLDSLAWNSHIYASVIGLCLLVLMVIVIAGGKLSFKASKTGIEADVARDDDPIPVKVTNAPDQPVPVEEAKP